MSVQMEESIFFWDMPDLNNLCAVRIILNAGISHPDIREKQLKLCRSLLFLYDHIVASPLPEEFSQILVIMSISFYKTGKLQLVAEKQQVKMARPERVTPAILQTCLLYTITVRLAPYWNKAGHLLIQGSDFITKSGKQDAVAIHITALDNQLFITVQVHTVRLPPCQLCDFDVASECFQSSFTWNSSCLRTKNVTSNWCYVLPSMKMGRIVHFSHDIPPECPFKSYKDFQNYWTTLYGYELPHMQEDDVIYCSVYFKFIEEKLFTYPLICLRSQPVQFYPRADLTRVLNHFVNDLKSKMHHLCGFPVNMTNTPVYPVKELSRPLPQDNKHLTNLTETMKLTMMPKNSDQSMYSTEIVQKMISLGQSLERCAEKLEHPPTSLYVEHMTLFKVPFGSQHCDSSQPVCSTHSGNVQKNVPFCGKTREVNQIDKVKFADASKTVVGSSVSDHLKKYTSNFNIKDTMPSRSSFIQISDATTNTASNVLHKEVLSNTTFQPCSSPLLEKQSCSPASLAFGKYNSNPNHVDPLQSQVFDSCTNDRVVSISRKRKEDYNVAGSVNIAACQLHEDNLQGENLVMLPKKCRRSKTVKEVDVEQHARDNKLFKLNNADLQEWLKWHGISTKNREKKEQLVAKIMQFIQQS